MFKNSISLPSGGFLKYASVSGQVVPMHKCICAGKCALAGEFAANNMTQDCTLHYFIERHGNKAMRVGIPEKFAGVLNSYKKAMNIKQIAPYNQEFEFFRVIGVHGDVPNVNGDMFRWGSTEDKAAPELLRYDDKIERYIYSTFIGKGNYKDHQNDSVIKAVGILLDAVPNHTVKGIEILTAVDKEKDPMLVRGINQGYITDVSMGARVTYSICSICDKVAHNEFEYCTHIKNYKGQYYSGPETSWKPKLAFEDNRGCEFIELSWVTVGADPKAKYLEKIAHLNRMKNREMLQVYVKEAEKELAKSEPNYHKINAALKYAIAQSILL
jgi:hypothetical protein